jgi:hypothetical protein
VHDRQAECGQHSGVNSGRPAREGEIRISHGMLPIPQMI